MVSAPTRASLSGRVARLARSLAGCEPAGLVLLFLLAFALRLAGLADHNIWWDEGLAAWAARLPLAGIIDWTAHDVHPPLYFLLLAGWRGLVGDGEFGLRFLSVLVGTLGVAAIYGLGRALGGRRAGLLAALWLTVSVFAISWSQEMRMYILAGGLATGALWAAFRLWTSRRWSVWLAYVLSCAAGLWTLYLSVSVPLIANLAFLGAWLRRGRPRGPLLRWASAQVAALALWLPWLVYALPRIPTWSTSESFSPVFFAQLYATMLAVGVPVNLDAYTPFTLAAFVLLALTLVPLWRAARSIELRAGVVMLLLGLVLPALVVYVVSLPVHIFYAPRLAPRYLLPLAGCYYLLLALGVAAIPRRRWWVAAAGVALPLVVALSGLIDFYPGRMRRDDLISLVATLEAHRQPDDAVVLHSDKDWPLFAARYAGEWRGVPYGAPVDAAGADALLSQLWPTSAGVWLVATPDAQRIDPEGAVRNWLEARAAGRKRWEYGDHVLTFYARGADRAARIHDLGPEAARPARASGRVAGLAGAWLPLNRYPTGDVIHLALYWDRPPTKPMGLELAGPPDGRGGDPVSREIALAPPAAATAGLTRQQVDIPLSADLPGGCYRLSLRVGDAVAPVGRFTLVSRDLETAVTRADIPFPLDVRLGPAIHLLGYGLSQATVEPGGRVDLTLYWQTQAVVTVRYKVFTHLVGDRWNPASGNLIWGQQDNEPVEGTTPTTVWRPGVILADRYAIPVSPDAPPGRYRLEVGLYGLVDGTRLPALDPADRPQGDSVLVAEIEVVEP